MKVQAVIHNSPGVPKGLDWSWFLSQSSLAVHETCGNLYDAPAQRPKGHQPSVAFKRIPLKLSRMTDPTMCRNRAAPSSVMPAHGVFRFCVTSFLFAKFSVHDLRHVA